MSESTSKIVKDARQWIASPRGRKAIAKIIKQLKHAQNELEKARRVDPKTLKQPATFDPPDQQEAQ